MVLCNFIDSSIVDAGFRGELLTKVICLIAMDELLDMLQPRQSPNPSPSKGSRSLSQRKPHSRIRTLSWSGTKSISGTITPPTPAQRARSQSPR